LPATRQDKRQLRFVGGLNTESGHLAPVPNTWADGLNMVPNIDGSIVRRTRIDKEADGGTITTVEAADVALQATSVGEWMSAAGDGALNYVAVQSGNMVYFRENIEPVSGAPLFSIDLNDYQVPGTPLACQFVPCSYASGTGRFFIVSAAITPLMVTLSEDESSIDVTELALRIRDFKGVFPDLDGSIDNTVGDGLRNEPATLTPAHHYNLLNQGWDEAHIGYFHHAGVPFGEAAGEPDVTITGAGTYPANTDRQEWGDNSMLVTRADSASGITYAWSFVGVRTLRGKTITRAPRGRFLISPFGEDRTTVSGVVGLPTSSVTYTRPTTVTFHAGRVWYSGIIGREQGQELLFSQVGDDPSTFANCYQAADPTSSDDSSIADSDGGVITIHEAGTILKLVSYQNMLVVIADNGVWQIAGGGAGGAFTATDYSVSRVSTIGSVNADSVVLVNDRILYWSDAAILQVTLPSTSSTGQLEATPVTDATIATFYTAINALSKKFSTGLYHSDEKLVIWLYNGGIPSGASYNWKKTKALILDLRLPAWYPFEFSDSNLAIPVSAFPFGMIVTRPISRGVEVDIEVVTSTPEFVVDSNDEQVVISIPTFASNGRVLKFLSYIPTGSTTLQLTAADLMIREYSDLLGTVRFYDWFSVDNQGTSFESFVETQWEEDGIGADKRFQNHYVTVFLRKTETGVESYDDGGGE